MYLGSLGRMCRHMSVRYLFSTTLLSLAVLLLFTKHTSSKRMYAQYSSDLQDLERFELQIAKEITQITLTTNDWTRDRGLKTLIENYLLDYYESSGLKTVSDSLAKDGIHASKNPICSYRLIRRVKSLLQDLVSHKSFPEIFKKLSKQVVGFFREASWPTRQDVERTIMGILRLQQVYDLRADQLANGWIYNVPTNCTLNSIHCYQIAKFANKTTTYNFAIEWFELAKQEVLVDKETSFEAINSSLKNVIQTHNREFYGKDGWEPKFFNRKIRHNIAGDSLRTGTKRNVLYEFFKRNRESKYNTISFWGLCSGENLQTEKEKSYLFCWREFKIHPSFTIGPIKMEFLARNPDIVQMYEVLKDKEADAVKLDAGAAMNESLTFVGTTEDKASISFRRSQTVRVSVNSWYGGILDGTLRRKIELLTGLNLYKTRDERFQVASYATGGQYEPHLDTTGSHNNTKKSDRIATFMFYLNVVEKGGSTVFPSSGVAANPTKGSAVFWHNLLSDGTSDFATSHGACPVVLGEKWVMNKWVGDIYQFQTRKCRLSPKERFSFPVNGVYLPIANVLKRDVKDGPELFVPPQPDELSKYSYVAPEGLRALAELEWKLYEFIRNIYHKHRNQTIDRHEFDRNNNDVKIYIDNFEASALNVIGLNDAQKGEKIAQNPLAAFKMIRRFWDYFKNWAQPQYHTGNKLLIRISSYLGRVYNVSDPVILYTVESSMFALLNIHFIYDLGVKDLAKGILHGVDTQVQLTAKDCALIGEYAVIFKFYTSAIEWLEHALYLIQNNLTTDYDNITYETVYDFLQSAEISHDDDLLENEREDSKFFTKPISQVPELSQRITNKLLQYEDSESKNYSLSRFSGICNGRFHQASSEMSKLFCWYEQEIHPSYKIAPIKAEFLSKLDGVEVVQYHDVIGHKTIAALKNLTNSNSKRISYSALTPSKAQRQEWSMKTGESEVTKNVVKLAQRLTGLKGKYKPRQEPLLVSANTPGGYSAEHVDKPPDILANFMFYLSDVKRGGETAFLNSGAKFVPGKGSAVFWYNKFSCGTLNKLVTYGDCPVIFGNKWAGLLVAYYENQHNLQCHLKPFTTHTILVNGH